MAGVAVGEGDELDAKNVDLVQAATIEESR